MANLNKAPVSAYEQAIRWLGRREYSHQELYQRLQRLNYSAIEIEQSLLQLRDCDYQSDERFCVLFLQNSLQRHQGPIKIKHQLRERGIASALIEQIIANHEINWQQRAVVALNKYLPIKHRLNQGEQAKALRFLAGRGFTNEQCYYALRHLASI